MRPEDNEDIPVSDARVDSQVGGEEIGSERHEEVDSSEDEDVGNKVGIGVEVFSEGLGYACGYHNSHVEEVGEYEQC